jgi:1,4-dihydroxy-2-naphthoate octaprenyltransferase
VEADKFAGRKHIPIILNRGRAADIYCLILVLVYALIIGTVAAGVLPLIALLGLATLPLGIKAIKGVLRAHSDRANLIPVMGMNVQVVLLTPLLMSTGILIGAFTFS